MMGFSHIKFMKMCHVEGAASSVSLLRMQYLRSRAGKIIDGHMQEDGVSPAHWLMSRVSGISISVSDHLTCLLGRQFRRQARLTYNSIL